jgi:glycosyltransferase involved in cell wall biosynthesis
MRIALFGDELLGWQGGRDFFRILFESLKLGCAAEDEIAIAMRVSRDALLWRAVQIGKHLLTSFPCDFRWIAREIRRTPRKKLIRQIIGENVRIAIFKEKGSLQVLSEFDVAGPFLYPPDWLGTDAWVGYLFDCQHRRLAHFFSPEERAARDDQFAALLRAAPVVIVHSLDVKADLLAYFAPVRGEIVALPLSAAAEPTWFQLDPMKVREKYRLPEQYFLCSNQFWQHKNHGVILEALAIARAQNKPMSVAFTGQMYDYRNPNYISDLIARVDALGISGDCHFLGLIPKLDQIAIMRSACAIIQPTLFEGTPGGLAVVDAIGVGQRVIVSDIPVNREIEEYVTEYFPPNDAGALFDAMCRLREQPSPRLIQDRLLAEGLERRRHFGSVVGSAFAMAIERTRQKSNVDGL